MRITPFFVAASVLIGLSVPARAQSLGELAAQEKQKRQGKPATKVINEGDLGRAAKRGTMSVTEGPSEGAPADATASADAGTVSPEAAPGTQAPEGTIPEGGGAPPADAAAGSEDANKPSAKKEKTEDEIRTERQAAFTAKLTKAQDNVRIYQTNVDAIQRDLNDISGGVWTERRNNVLKMLDETKVKLAAAQAELAALEDEGRRSGFPR
jgi:hypothetical protein